MVLNLVARRPRALSQRHRIRKTGKLEKQKTIEKARTSSELLSFPEFHVSRFIFSARLLCSYFLDKVCVNRYTGNLWTNIRLIGGCLRCSHFVSIRLPRRSL